MKKLSYLLLSAMVIFSAIGLCACGGEDNKQGASEPASSSEVETTTVKETEAETTTVDNSKTTYKVTVVDDAGNPVVGAMVQCCKDSCVPGVTNDSGVAEFVLVEDTYDVKFVQMPEGYEYSSDVEVFNFEDGQTELTITIKKVS